MSLTEAFVKMRRVQLALHDMEVKLHDTPDDERLLTAINQTSAQLRDFELDYERELKKRDLLQAGRCRSCQGQGGYESVRRGWIPCEACGGKGS